MRPNGGGDDGTAVHTKCLNEMASFFVARLFCRWESFLVAGRRTKVLLLLAQSNGAVYRDGSGERAVLIRAGVNQ